MEILKIIILSFTSAIVLLILTKLMGNKEMSQLSMFDYIVGITIGSIAAEMSTALESNFMQPLVAMIVYALISILISVLSCKSLKLRRIFSSPSLILFDNGILYRKNFKKSKLDLNEFLTQCRVNGYFNLNDIQTAILESNGKLSFIPKVEKRPATPSDLNLKLTQERITVNVILDGNILKENLYYTGNNELWLEKQLVSQGFENEKNIFLATCDSENKLSIYRKEDIQNSKDFFA